MRGRVTAGVRVIDDFASDLVGGLADEIMARAQQGVPSYPSLNQGGWKSGETLFDWESAPCVHALRHELGRYIGIDAVKHRKIIGWAMVNRGGSFHPIHTHKTAIETGIFYVTPGDPPTPTIFEPAGDIDPFEIDPRPGRLVLFPGNLWHSVPKYPGNTPRITIAFDIRR